MASSWLSNPTSSHVFTLSIVSCVITLVAAIAGIVAYDSSGSTAVLGFGIENVIDLLSSAIVIWRFYAPSKEEDMDEDYLKKLQKREKRASVGIAFVMLILAWALSIAAFDEIAQGVGEDEEYDNQLLILSIPSMFVFSILAWIKFRYADLLKSSALQKDAICSLFGAILSISVILNSFIISRDPDAWFLDPLVAIFVSAACFIVGTRTILKNSYEHTPFLSFAWWMTDPSDRDERGNVSSTQTTTLKDNDVELSIKEASDDVEDRGII